MEGKQKAMNERNLNEGQWDDRKQWSLGAGQRKKLLNPIYTYNIAFHFSDFGLSLDPVLHKELVFLPSNHLIVGMSSGFICRPYKRPKL